MYGGYVGTLVLYHTGYRLETVTVERVNVYVCPAPYPPCDVEGCASDALFSVEEARFMVCAQHLPTAVMTVETSR